MPHLNTHFFILIAFVRVFRPYGAFFRFHHLAVRRATALRLRLLARSIILYGMSEVTHILSNVEQGDPRAAERLLPLIYDELRRLAAQKLAQERPDHTLQATALVHEAYLRLVESTPREQSWGGRGHFFAAAAEAMRRILVENARRKSSLKRGGGLARQDFDVDQRAGPEASENLLPLDAALQRVGRKDPIKAEVVKLR